MGSEFLDAPVFPGNPVINSVVKNQSVVKHKTNSNASQQVRSDGTKCQVSHKPRFVYNKNFKSSDIEGLLVRPLAQALMVYRTASVQKHRSYANVVKTDQFYNPMNRKQSVPKIGVMKHCVNMSSNSLNNIKGKDRFTQVNKISDFTGNDTEINAVSKLVSNSMNSIGKTSKEICVTGRDLVNHSISTSVSSVMDSIGDKQSCHAVGENLVKNTEVNSVKYSSQDKKQTLLCNTTSVSNVVDSISGKQSCHAVGENPVKNTEVNSVKYSSQDKKQTLLCNTTSVSNVVDSTSGKHSCYAVGENSVENTGVNSVKYSNQVKKQTSLCNTSFLNGVDSTGDKQNCHGVVQNSVESPKVDVKYLKQDNKQKLLYDCGANNEDKYLHSLLFCSKLDKTNIYPDCTISKLCKHQSHMKFGFIPLSDPILPVNYDCRPNLNYSVVELHSKVKEHDAPNFIGARIPVPSQLNIPVWKEWLSDYWDQQLLQFLEFGFPIGFNRNCPLNHDGVNHKTATDFPTDVDAYIQEEIQYGAIVGPFDENPIVGSHISPIMTRPKPNSDTRRVIIDLSWPKGESVNDGVDKLSYMGSEFKLTFPSIDDLTTELRKLGRGAHIYKIDVSRAFRHLNMDPLDFDLLGLQWNQAYIDTRLPFGACHGSQMFQRVSDAVRYIMRCQNYDIINYIDDFLGFGTPTVAKRSFDALYDAMQKLGLCISNKKLIHPGTQAVCLGVLVDTVTGTVSIPPEKLGQVKDMVSTWSTKKYCTKRQLQSLLGLLLYIHKCVKPARYFVNRMLEVLRNAQNPSKICLTDDFWRDLNWFQKFLDQYNGTSLFDHRPIDCVFELDACLTGLGGCWKNFVYHLPIPLGYKEMGIVHLEMINVLVALKLFKSMWSGKKVLIKCDNQAVVTVLTSGRTKDPFLGACARNVWFTAALADVELQYTHVLGKYNRTADLLSRWQNSASNVLELSSLVQDPVWLNVKMQDLEIDVSL